MFHEMLERIDFPPAERDGVSKIASSALDRYGFDSDAWSVPVADAVLALIDAALGGEAPPLRRVDRASRVDEMRFVFPARRPGTDTPITVAGLVDALRRGGDGGFGVRCAERARELTFERFSGFVSGAIDLVFAHGGKWFIADYKTNHLGLGYEDYSAESLERAMLHHHYYLQYHLYALALHRHLRVRLSGYDYDAHFGGVRYLFLRGMSADERSGVFAARPARAVIDALDALFAEEGRVTP